MSWSLAYRFQTRWQTDRFIQEASLPGNLRRGKFTKNIYDDRGASRGGRGTTACVYDVLQYHSPYGVETFVKRCNAVGVDGLIIPDLPLEEQEELQQYLKKSDTTILIQLVSPVSGDRIPKILDGAKGFVYCVSSMGVTGQDDGFYKEVKSYLKKVKDTTELSGYDGFGN